MSPSPKRYVARIRKCLPVLRRATKKYEAAVAKASRSGHLDLAAIERARRAYQKAMQGCKGLF